MNTLLVYVDLRDCLNHLENESKLSRFSVTLFLVDILYFKQYYQVIKIKAADLRSKVFQLS